MVLNGIHMSKADNMNQNGPECSKMVPTCPDWTKWTKMIQYSPKWTK